MRTLSLNLIIVLFASLTPPSFAAKPETAFEGILKIEQNKKHVGYAIYRADWLADKKQRIVTLFINRTKDGKAYSETTRVIADEDFNPMYSIFESNEVTPNELRIASFVGHKDKIPVWLFEKNIFGKEWGIKSLLRPGSDQLDEKRLDKLAVNTKRPSDPDADHMLPRNPGAFISGFLFYVLDIPRMEANSPKRYEGFSEPDGRFSIGAVTLLGQKSAGKTKIYHFDDYFAGEPIENFVTETGDPVGTRSSLNQIVTYLTTKEDAVGEFDFPQAKLTAIFEDLPDGRKNVFMQAEEKIDIRKIIDSFAEPKAGRDVDSEEIPVIDIKVPVKRGK